MQNQFITYAEIANTLNVSKSTAHRIGHALNEQFKADGGMVLRGKVSRAYFEAKYGISTTAKPKD